MNQDKLATEDTGDHTNKQDSIYDDAQMLRKSLTTFKPISTPLIIPRQLDEDLLDVSSDTDNIGQCE